MQTIILAANDNAQLRPPNLRKPRTLIKINGISLREHQILGHSRAGVETASISVVTGHQYGQVKRYLARGHPDILLVRNPDYRSAGALYSLDLALRRAEPYTADEELFISSGECIYDDGAIERVSRVSGSAIVGDSSRYGCIDKGHRTRSRASSMAAVHQRQLRLRPRRAHATVVVCPHALCLAISLVVAVSTALAAQNGLVIRRHRLWARAMCRQ